MGSLPAASSCTLSCIGTLLNGSSVSNSSIKGWTCRKQHALEAAPDYAAVCGCLTSYRPLPGYYKHSGQCSGLVDAFDFTRDAPNSCTKDMQASCNVTRALLLEQLQTTTAVLPTSSWKACANLLRHLDYWQNLLWFRCY